MRSPGAIRISRSTRNTPEDQGTHDRDLLPVAAGRLPAGVEDGADAEGDPRRHRRRGREAAVHQRGLRLHAAAREVDAAREGLLDRHHRRRARDDRGRGRLGSADGEARREQGGPREARRPAHDQDGRRARRSRLRRRAAPVYYITGTIHSTEAGAPTALMELAYRLAVDDSAYVRNIREHVITLITPVVEARRPRPDRRRLRVAQEAPERDADEPGLLGPLRRSTTTTATRWR